MCCNRFRSVYHLAYKLYYSHKLLDSSLIL